MRMAAKRAEFAISTALGVLPVVTYASWRTASTACHRAIRAAGCWPAVKAHALHPDDRFRRYAEVFRGPEAAERRHVGDWAVRSAIVVPAREARWIIMVRDPLAVAASIASLERHLLDPALARTEPHGQGLDDPSMPELLAALAASAPVDLLDRWFEFDVRPTLGWSPLDEPFDRERGWSESSCRLGRVLTLRADIPDERKGEAISGFLGRRVVVRRLNGARSNGRGAVLGALSRRLADLPEVRSNAFSTAVARHFWHAADLARLHAALTGIER